MGVNLTTKMSDVNALMKDVQRQVEEAEKRALIKMGKGFVGKVRNRSYSESWVDVSGDLRSSIGCVVSEKGNKVYQSSFEQVKDGAKGSMLGKQQAEELAASSKNLRLDIVAGVDYAEDVEARDNKDVFASAQLWMEDEAERIIQESINGLKL